MELKAENLSVLRGEDRVLSGLSFSSSAGTALIVTGTNGAGKSTLLRAIAGLLPIESGTLSLTNPDLDFADASLPDQCHYLGHENAMKPSLTVAENLEFWKEFCGHPHLDTFEALAMVGLEGLDDIPFSHLSTGQRRRAALARLLVSYRPVWLLDEPTAGLDAASEEQLSALMNAHLEDGGMIIVATHVPLHLPGADQLSLGEG